MASPGRCPWLIGLCSVVFDVDYGQKVNFVVPNDCITEAERTDVGFNSFPDSLSMELQNRSSIRDSSFCFRIRRRSNNPAQDADKFIYGFVFCRQRYDNTLRRGGEQSSVVVLSRLPFTSVLRPLSQIAGPLFFNEGPAALERVYKEALAWPMPRAGRLMQLPVNRVSIAANLPSFQTAPHPHFTSKETTQLLSQLRRGSRSSSDNLPLASRLSRSTSLDSTPSTDISSHPGSHSPSTPSPLDTAPAPPSPSPLASSPSRTTSQSSLSPRPSVADPPDPTLHPFFSDFDIFTTFQSVLPSLWTLWELALTGQPLLIASPSPADASAAVCGLLSLLAPLPYSGDFRPYYTIHDPSFKLLSALPTPPPADGALPSIIGVTNVFFVKALEQWANVLSVGTKAPQVAWSGGAANGAAAGQSGRPAAAGPKKKQSGPQQLLVEHVEKLWTPYKPLLRADTQLLSRLARPPVSDAKARTRAATVNSDALRRHFTALTTALLAPLAPYYTPGPTGRVQGWDQAAFLAGLKANKPDPALLSRLNGNMGQVVELYKRFFASPTFQVWFRHQLQLVAHLIDEVPGGGGGGGGGLAREAAFRQAMQHMDEVQLVQAFYSLETQLAAATEDARKAPASGAAAFGAVERLKLELSAVFAAMPEDLQVTMASSPARQQLLHSLQCADPQNAAMFAALLAQLRA